MPCPCRGLRRQARPSMPGASGLEVSTGVLVPMAVICCRQEGRRDRRGRLMRTGPDQTGLSEAEEVKWAEAS